MLLRNVLRSSCSLIVALVIAACSVPPRTGWEPELRSGLRDVEERFGKGSELLSGLAPATTSAKLTAGDELVFGVSLENGDRVKTWYLRLRVLGLELGDGLGGRRQTGFERRVKPSPERARQLLEQNEKVWAMIRRMDTEGGRKLECVRICVDAFDADARPLESAETTVVLSSLRDIYASCLAGHRQRHRMRGRVALGDDAEVLELDDAAYDDVMVVAQGVGSSELLFELLQSNPVTRDILFEVIALPTLWSIVSTMRIRASMAVDFFEAEPVEPGTYRSAGRPLWSVPVTVLLNDQPALYAFLVAGPDGSPDGASAGVFALVGRHPTDDRRKVVVQLLASRRGG